MDGWNFAKYPSIHLLLFRVQIAGTAVYAEMPRIPSPQRVRYVFPLYHKMLQQPHTPLLKEVFVEGGVILGNHQQDFEALYFLVKVTYYYCKDYRHAYVFNKYLYWLLISLHVLFYRFLSSMRSISQTTVDPKEVKKFQSLASKWWDERGEFAALHAMNDLRVPFIRSAFV